MKTIRVPLGLGLVLGALVSLPASAQSASASNPNATLSIVGNAVLRLAPGATIDHPFTVRIVDSQGAPLAGLGIQFFTDGCLPLPLQPDPCPPAEVYGHFSDQSVADRVISDVDGNAVAPEYVGGSTAGIYWVAACIFVADYPENAIIGNSLCVDLQIEQIAVDDAVPITSAFTGAWYDPQQSGHGLMLEVLPDNRLLGYWFSFDPDGFGQVWFGGVGAIENDLAILHVDMGSGGRWIPHFDPLQFSLVPWGTLIFQFSDCNHGRVDFSADNQFSAYGTGSMNLTRLTMPAGLSCD